MTSPLVDGENFPLASVDIVAVRSARQKIHELRNDRMALDSKIKDLLELAFEKPDTNSDTSMSDAEPVAQNSHASNQLPFAKVNSVAAGSPAEEAVSLRVASSMKKTSLSLLILII